MYHNRNN